MLWALGPQYTARSTETTVHSKVPSRNECHSMPSVSPSANEVCAESLSSPRVVLNKEYFVECPINCTRQRVGFQ
jgi:hypothetical protein